jgi:hypothetical protein
VRSLDDKNTRFVSSRIHNFSHLESIEVYTNSDNVNLVKVFEAMDSSNESIPSESDAAEVKKYFEKVYGDIDFTRVYNSDMKKMVRWFNILKANQVEIKLQEPEVEETEPETESVEEKPVKIEEKKQKPKKAAKEKAPEEPKKEKVAKKAAKSSDTKAPAKAKKKEEKSAPKKSAKKSAGKSGKKK